MGTSWTVKLIQESSITQVIDTEKIQARLNAVDQAMSNWKSDSDVSRLNSMPAGCLLVSEHTERVAKAAYQIGQQSNGYLDVTLSPLIELWGFGVKGEPPAEPSPELLSAAFTLNSDAGISTADRQLCKKRDDIQVNYSAIAKGYAVDQVAELLKESGYNRFLVEVGGELYGQGTKINGEAWKVGIERPSYGLAQELYSTLELNGMAVATSGDYRNYYEINSVRYSHIINPKTGRPVEHNTASVTVVHTSVMVADAWATALLAAGPVEGMQLAEENGLKALMILHSVKDSGPNNGSDNNDSGFDELTSSHWID